MIHVSEILDPDEDEDEEQNTSTLRRPDKESYISEWISASSDKAYTPGARKVIDQLKETTLTSPIIMRRDSCEPCLQKPQIALRLHGCPTSVSPGSAITTLTPDGLGYVSPSHDDLMGIRAKNLRLREEGADEQL